MEVEMSRKRTERIGRNGERKEEEVYGSKSSGAETEGAGVREGERRWERRQAVELRHEQRQKGRWSVAAKAEGKETGRCRGGLLT